MNANRFIDSFLLEHVTMTTPILLLHYGIVLPLRYYIKLHIHTYIYIYIYKKYYYY